MAFQFQATEAGLRLGLPERGSVLPTADEATWEAIGLLEEGDRFENSSPLLSEGEVWGSSSSPEPFAGGVVGTYRGRVYAASEGHDGTFTVDLAEVREVE